MDFQKVVSNLTKNGFAVSCFSSAKDAADYLNSAIDGTRVGIGGSVTVQEMKLYESLSAHNTVFWHWRIPEGDSRENILKNAQTAEVYLSSVNGLSENGEIINIDGSGNRVSAIQFGHKKVYLIVGCNKLAPDYEKALFRARNTAAPKNAQRLKLKTPCAKEGKACFDCQSPDRICRGLSVLWKKPNNGEYEIVLVDEELGY